jgi:hypothetical protein
MTKMPKIINTENAGGTIGTIGTSKTNKTNQTNRTIGALSELYYGEAERLDKYIVSIKAKIKERPEPDELSSLEKRLETLKAEKRDLLNTALCLRKMAAPPPKHPSILYGEREAS